MKQENAVPADPDILSAEDEFVSLTGFAVFENVGDKIRGQYGGVMHGIDFTREDGTVSKPIPQHILITSDGVVRANETVQMAILRGVDPGTEVEIEYTGEAKTRAGYRVKRFDIRVRRSILNKSVGKIVEAQRAGLLAPPPVTIEDKDPFADDEVPAVTAS